MTRFALLAFALFTSACAVDVDANIEDANDELRASLEDVGTDTERSSTLRNQRLARRVMHEYSPLAAKYDCKIVNVVAASWTDRSMRMKGDILTPRGKPVGQLTASMRRISKTAGTFTGQTRSGLKKGADYNMKGQFAGQAIEADMMVASNDNAAQDLEVLADWNRKGNGGTMQGVVVDCR